MQSRNVLGKYIIKIEYIIDNHFHLEVQEELINFYKGNCYDAAYNQIDKKLTNNIKKFKYNSSSYLCLNMSITNKYISTMPKKTYKSYMNCIETFMKNPEKHPNHPTNVVSTILSHIDNK